MQQFYKSIILLLLCLVGTGSSATAQKILKKTCATHDAVMEFLLKDNNYKNYAVETEPDQRSGIEYSVPVMNSDTTYTIPVVVHIVYFDNNKYENISDSVVYSQIEALNRDFNLQNDTSYIRPEFLQFLGNARIKFELAKVDPTGKPTTGITRKQVTPRAWMPLPVDNIKYRASDGVPTWGYEKYLNIWVGDLNYNSRKPNSVDVCDTCGLLGGYATPPKGLAHWVVNVIGIPTDGSSLTKPSNDGVVIDFRFFGQNNAFNKDFLNGSRVYGQGRTTVHEVGHYLGLRHSWGDGNVYGIQDCSAYDDGITDTPSEKEPYANYIEPGNICGLNVNSCVVPYPGDGVDYPDMRENYMNYATDLCYAMFTKEQVNMMRYVLLEKRNSIIIKREVESVPTGTAQHKNALDVEVYPNPVKGSLQVHQHTVSNSVTFISIYNSLGALVKSEQVAAGTSHYNLDMSNLAPSAYVIHFQNGEQSKIHRVVVQ